MKAFKKRRFGLIELVLSIAVFQVGLSAAVSLVPTGLKSEAETKVRYYASDIADTANSFAESALAGDWLSTMKNIPETKPLIKIQGTDQNWDLLQYDCESTGQKNVYSYENHGLKGVYKVLLTSSNENNNITDMVGELKIWKTPVGKLNPTFGDNKLSEGSKKIDINQLVGLNMEISCPAQIPYEQREKFKYYFEVFNYYNNTDGISADELNCPDDDEEQTIGPPDNPTGDTGDDEEEETVDDSTEEEPVIEKEEDNEIKVNKNLKLKLNIVASELCAGTKHAPVYVRVSITEPGCEDPEGLIYNCFSGYSYFYDMSYDLTGTQNKRVGSRLIEVAAIPGSTYEIEIPAGSTYKVWTGYYYRRSGYSGTYARYDYYGRDYGYVVNSYWSTNEHQVYTLLNGEQPPRFNPTSYQLTPEECVAPYINDDGVVELADNQVLYLFELSHTRLGDSGFDMQDMVLLAELE